MSRKKLRQAAPAGRVGAADRRAEPGVVLEVLDLVRAAGTLADAVAATAECVQRRFGWPYAAYLWRDPVDGLLKCRDDWGEVAEEFRAATRAARFRQDEALSGLAREAGEVVVVEDFGAVAAFARAPIARRSGVRFAVALPILVNGTIAGTLEWYATDAGRAPDAQLVALRRIGFLLAAKASEADLERFVAMSESSPINTVFADVNLTIAYLNPAAVKSWAKLGGAVGLRSDELLGRRLDLLHPSLGAAGQASDPARLPQKTVVDIGADKVELLVSPIRDADGTFLGVMVTWEIVTRKLKTQTELARALSMLENAPSNILSCDPDLSIGYANPATMRTLQSLAGRVPLRAEELLGQPLTVLYPDGEAMRHVLSDPANLPHRAQVRLGSEDVDVIVVAVYDFQRHYLGPDGHLGGDHRAPRERAQGEGGGRARAGDGRESSHQGRRAARHRGCRVAGRPHQDGQRDRPRRGRAARRGPRRVLRRPARERRIDRSQRGTAHGGVPAPERPQRIDVGERGGDGRAGERSVRRLGAGVAERADRGHGLRRNGGVDPGDRQERDGRGASGDARGEGGGHHQRDRGQVGGVVARRSGR